jgi:hypothetical protein
LRESIPVEAILKAYMDETLESDVTEEIKEQYIEESVQQIGGETPQIVQSVTSDPDIVKQKKLSFNDTDYIKDTNNNIVPVNAPKSVDYLEKMNSERVAIEARQNEDENVKLQIFDGPVTLDNLEIHDIQEPKMDLLPELLTDDIEFEILS